MKINLLFLAFVAFSFSNCTKSSSSSVCDKIKNASIISTSPVTLGQTARFGTQNFGNSTVYNWNGPDNYQHQDYRDSLFYVQLRNQGWYYLSVFSPDGSCKKVDSFFLDVKLMQETPACNLANNTSNYSNMGNDNFSSITKSVDRTYSLNSIYSSGGVGSNLTIYFHPYWRGIEPEDGVYTTYNRITFDESGLDYNTVFVTTTKQSIYWQAYSNQKVYISHVGQKLQVRFCNLSMSGSNGTVYTTTASANVVEQ